MIVFHDLATKLETSIKQSVQELAYTYAQDPEKADVKLNNLTIAQIGQVPITPISYFQKCGDFFLYSQTCEHKERIIAQTVKDLDEYYAKYKVLRLQIVTSMTYELTQKEQRDQLLLYFQSGQSQLQKAISKQFSKIESLKKFESIAWTIFSAGVATVSAGNKAVMSAGLFATNAIKDLSDQTSLNVNSLHRFSEEPPEFNKKQVTSGYQWDHFKEAILLARLLQEYEQVYFTVFPEMKPIEEKKQSAEISIAKPLIFLLLAGIVFKKLI